MLTSFNQFSATCNGGRDASCTALLRFLAALRRFLATVALLVPQGEGATGLEEKAPDVAVGTISWTTGAIPKDDLQSPEQLAEKMDFISQHAGSN